MLSKKEKKRREANNECHTKFLFSNIVYKTEGYLLSIGYCRALVLVEPSHDGAASCGSKDAWTIPSTFSFSAWNMECWFLGMARPSINSHDSMRCL